MALEKEEYLWRMVNEHMTQARHQETLRSSMTTLLVTLSGAIVGFITFDKVLWLTDLAPSLLLFFLGAFGIFFSAKQYDRFDFHIARVRSDRNALERYFPDGQWKELREEADKYHVTKYPHLVKQRQNILWLVLHGVNATLGLVLTTIILFTQ